MENRKINILGTEYRIETHKVSEDSYLEDNKLSGYCGEEEKLIVVADMSEEKYFTGMDEKAQEAYRKRVLRHEIMHAFLNESGLSDSSNRFDGAWAKNEEMVDWFAIQSPKIYDVYLKLGLVNGTTVIIQQDCVEKLELARDVLKEQNDKLRGIINSFGREVPCE